MIKRIFFGVLLVLLFQISFADLYIPVERYMYIYKDGVKVEQKGKISVKGTGYMYFPWDDSKQDTTSREMDILNLAYDFFGSKNFEVFSTNYLVIDSYRIVGNFDDGSQFSYPIKQYSENCKPLEQFEMSMYGKNGAKYYKTKEGYEKCMEENNYNEEVCKEYVYEVEQDTFKKNPRGDILESVCEFKYDIPEKYWIEKPKQKYIKTSFRKFLDYIHEIWK